MDQYQLIRQLYLVEGMSQRAIAKQLRISRNTVRRYCKGEQVPWERKPVKRAPSVITPDIINLLNHVWRRMPKVQINDKSILPSESMTAYVRKKDSPVDALLFVKQLKN